MLCRLLPVLAFILMAGQTTPAAQTLHFQAVQWLGTVVNEPVLRYGIFCSTKTAA